MGQRLVSLVLAISSLTGFGETSPLHADRIVIVKSAHSMILYRQGRVLRQYKVALGRGSSGPKERAGDHKTPEGQYVVDSRNATSKFHLALHLSYPNTQDRMRAALSHINPGGDIEIHGLPRQFAFTGSLQHAIDWTDGCVAVSNPEIDEIWKLVPMGTRVEILP
jgi:murein L,D-transpeptidase YafK